MSTERVKLFETYTPLHLIDLLKCAEAVESEVRLRFSGDGIRIQEVDRKEHIKLVDLLIKPSYFETFTSIDKELSFNLTDMIKVLGKVTKDDKLEAYYIPYEETGTNPKIEFIIQGAKRLTRSKKMSAITPIEDEIPIPRIAFNSKTRVILDALRFAVEDLKDTSECISFTSTQESLTLRSEGDLSSDSTAFLKRDDNTISHDVTEDAKATYRTELLTSILKPASKVSEVANIELSEDVPIRIDAELSPNMGSLIYYIAPCIGV